MTQVEILEELKKLTPDERITIVEAALQHIREDLRRMQQPSLQDDSKKQLVEAAKALLPDYSAGGELTIFTALDGEDFHV